MALSYPLLLATAVAAGVMLCATAPTVFAGDKSSASTALPADFYKQTQWQDDSKQYFSSEAIVFIAGAKPCLSFRSYSPVTGHSTEFIVPAKFTRSDRLSFIIDDDGWGARGTGTIVLKKSGCVINMVQTKASDTGLSAGETWLENEFLPRRRLTEKLPKKCCLEH